MLLRDHPFLLFAMFLGIGVMAVSGAVCWAIALYGFCRWVEVKKAQIKRKARRKARLHYGDML